MLSAGTDLMRYMPWSIKHDPRPPKEGKAVRFTWLLWRPQKAKGVDRDDAIGPKKETDRQSGRP